MTATLPPDDLSRAQKAELWGWAKRHGFTKSDCRTAFETVKDWAEGSGKRRVNWVAVIRNAMRSGWALPRGRQRSVSEAVRRPTTGITAEPPLRLVKGGGDRA